MGLVGSVSTADGVRGGVAVAVPAECLLWLVDSRDSGECMCSTAWKFGQGVEAPFI